MRSIVNGRRGASDPNAGAARAPPTADYSAFASLPTARRRRHQPHAECVGHANHARENAFCRPGKGCRERHAFGCWRLRLLLVGESAPGVRGRRASDAAFACVAGLDRARGRTKSVLTLWGGSGRPDRTRRAYSSITARKATAARKLLALCGRGNLPRQECCPLGTSIRIHNDYGYFHAGTQPA
jgi:hypothetical protein